MNDLEQILSPVISNLISGIEKIRSKRDGFLDATKAKFNVFTILLNAHDEVRLHTRFITAMLDGSKDATHGCGTLFLKLFLETLGRVGCECNNPEEIPAFAKLLSDDNNFEFIAKEYHTSQGNIDILIHLQGTVIAIENKIWAREQESQLFRYSEYLETIRKEKKFLFFLTLDGHNASSNQNKKYFKISYCKHIIPWLDLCLENTYSYPNINAVIAQYKKVVQFLLKNSFEEEDMEEIKKLVEKNPAIVKYSEEINNCVSKIKKDYEKLFFKSLFPKDPELDIDSLRSPDGGLYYDIDSSNNFFKNNGLVLTVAIDSIFTAACSFYMGVVNPSGKELPEDVKAKIEHIQTTLKENLACGRFNPQFWPAGAYCIVPDGTINMEWLCNALSTPDFMEQRMDEYARKINEFIKITEDACPQ